MTGTVPSTPFGFTGGKTPTPPKNVTGVLRQLNSNILVPSLIFLDGYLMWNYGDANFTSADNKKVEPIAYVGIKSVLYLQAINRRKHQHNCRHQAPGGGRAAAAAAGSVAAAAAAWWQRGGGQLGGGGGSFAAAWRRRQWQRGGGGGGGSKVAAAAAERRR